MNATELELQNFQQLPDGGAPFAPVLELVPHDLPMCLLDEVLTVSPTALVARVGIHSDTLLVEPEGVPVAVGIEYMAQAVAAFAGHHGLLAGKPVKIGFLVGSRRFEASAGWFPLGEQVYVRVEREVQGDNGLGVFSCVIRSASVEVNANLSVFQPENVADFLIQ